MTRLRTQDGMTLPELLVAMTVGFVVLAATFGLLDSTLRLSGGVMAKTDAMQRGRLAVDQVTQQLRSQVCLDLTTPAIVPGSTASSVTFYADFGTGDPDDVPDRRTLSLVPGTGIVQTVATGTREADGDVTYGSARENLLLENAAVQPGAPFLTYFAYQETGTPPRLDATEVLSPPLNDAEAARVARIDVAFAAWPTGARTDKDSVHLEDRVAVRHADPNLSVPDPICV